MAASASRRTGVIAWAVTLVMSWCCTLHAEALRDVVDAYEGLARANDPNEGPGWPDVSAAASARRLEQYNQLRDRLATLDDAQLTDEERLTHVLLAWRLGVLIEAARFDEDRIPSAPRLNRHWARASTFVSFTTR